jgi:tetratricopeptide (TPR) repeat protein
MSAELFLSRFTPSIMSADVLEKVLVQRGHLANRLVEVIRESVLTRAKHHTLVIGSRGIGKTHLLSLVQNRIAGQEDITERVRIAWLREEEWGVASFLDFLYRILRALAARYQDDALRDETETLFSLPLRTAERRAADLLRSFVEGKTLLLIAENLDSVFQGLGKKGQQRLRAYLQEESSWTILASSQALFAGVALYESPFYGFFDIQHLQELSVDDAVLLVQNIAELANDSELASYVQSEAGRARIRAVHHLAGGNHRVYMILSEFLTRDSLDQLVDPFLRMMDDLTPYYQARMEQLSPQQRKIVDLLCSVRGAVPVKEIAKRCFITSQTASSQLKDLRDRGYVDATPVGRDNYYELSEPLMRLAVEVKNQRNGHIRLFVDFLRHWYAKPELLELLARTPVESAIERAYLKLVLAENDDISDAPQLRDLESQVSALIQASDWKGAFPIVERLVHQRGSVNDWLNLGSCFLHLGRSAEALAASDKVLAADRMEASAWALRSVAFLGLDRREDALNAISIGIDLDPSSARMHAICGVVLKGLGRLKEALQSYDRAVEVEPEVIRAWSDRAGLLKELGRAQDALESVSRGLEIDPTALELNLKRGEILNSLGRFSEATDEFDVVIANSRELSPRAQWGKAFALTGLEEHQQAFALAKRVQARAPDSVPANWLVAWHLVRLGRFQAAVPFITTAERSHPNEGIVLELAIRIAFGLDRLDDARLALGRLFCLPKQNDTLATLIIADIWDTGNFRSTLPKIELLYQAYEKHERLGVLASSLVEASAVLAHPTTSIAEADLWVEIWKGVAGTSEQFRLALNLMDVLSKFHRTQDNRVLLGLPVEERRIAEDLLRRAREM